MSNASQVLSDLVSTTGRELCEIVNYVFVISFICLFGVTTNIINITVFYQQGFNNTVTISFFALAVSDLCSLITLLWSSVCVNPLFINSDTIIFPPEIQYLTGGMSHICFARITGWITVFITAERCLCITLPLKIKLIVTPRRTTVIIILIYILVMASFSPEYQTAYFDWKFFSNFNKTLVGLVFTSNRYKMEGVVFFLYSVLGTASFLAVIIFTVILVIQLRRKSNWRRHANSDRVQRESVSNRDRKTMNMVVVIATVLIACYTPGICVSMVTFFLPELSIVGRYVNLFFVLWSFGFMFEALNSSVNIFFYYHMSTKYRDLCRVILGCGSENTK